MTTIFAIIAQLVLAFAILSLVYLFISYFLRQSFSGKQLLEEIKKLPDFERHIAIIFKDNINEEQLLLQVQWLLKQEYKNFSAYFFCSENIVEFNSIHNINILPTSKIWTNPKELTLLIKEYFPNLPSKIVCVKSKANLPNDFLFKHNEELFYGNYSQAYLKFDNSPETLSKLKQFQNYLLAKIEVINSLIENSNKKETFSTSKINANFHFVLGLLITCSITLSGINSLDFLGKSIFDYISITGIIASAIILISVNLTKRWKSFERGSQFS